MCEVTTNNFEDKLPEIKEAFRNANFLTIDCEFSSLCSNLELQNSLFDTPSQRYVKTRQNIKSSIPVQIGISAFTFQRDENVYTAKPYVFYIMPTSFSFVDQSFICTSSSFKFLCDYKFDFNKFVYGGIPYLNQAQEEKLRQSISEGTFYDSVKYSLQNKFKDLIPVYSSKVSEWVHSKDSSTELTLFDVDDKNYDFVYVMHKELRNRFCSKNSAIWTWVENKQFKIKKTTEEEYKLHRCKANLDQEVLEHYLGFSKVIKYISCIKKPIVGHNFFLDLMIILNSFNNELPNDYLKFKRLCCDTFAEIYDTKFLSFEVRRDLKEESKWQSNGLEQLYTYFCNGKGRHLVKNSPPIEIEKAFKTLSSDSFHNAGWDSFCTGYCFIRIAHFLAAKKYENSARVFMSSEHMQAVKVFKNQVNVIRATVSHLNLSGEDPISQRPPCLIIQSKNNKAIDIYRVSEILNQYGSVEIKPYSDRGRIAIAAVANFSSARRIIGQFQKHEDFHIAKYNVVKHSPVFRSALWGGVLITSSALLWLIVKL